VIAALLLSSLAAGAPWVLAVGVNRPAESSVGALHYADDDAVGAVRLFPTPADHTWLLTVTDQDTSAQHPAWAQRARVPTRAELFASVEQAARGAAAERAAGGEPVVLVWLVGHGVLDGQGAGGFALLDGLLTAEELRDRVLGPLSTSAHRVHLVVDSCHAAALVRARALSSAVTPEEAGAGFADVNRLAFANVGVVLASAHGQKTYEWDAMRSGIFSSLVRSALRGLADVDQDGAVSYAEMAAFGASAVESIADPRARPRMDIRPPSVDVHTPLARKTWHGELQSVRINQGGWGRFSLEDDSGVVWAAGNLEPGFEPLLWLALAPDHVVVTDTARFRTSVQDGAVALAATPNTTHSRGSVSEALQRGLLTSAYGPAYVRGFAAAWSGSQQPEAPVTTSTAARPAWRKFLWLALPALGALGVGALAGAAAGVLLLVEGLWSGTHASYERSAWQGMGRGAAGGVVAGLGVATVVGLVVAAALVAVAAVR